MAAPDSFAQRTTGGFAAKSLACPSAEIWFDAEASTGRARLNVKRWKETAGGGSSLSEKSRDGLWAPQGTTLEVKGGFLTDRNQERIPLEKVERAMEIHLAGYT